MLTSSVGVRGSAEPRSAAPGAPLAPPAPARPPAPAATDLRWITQGACPPDWWAHVERCGGGFFHTPPGLGAGAPVGEPVFAQLLHGADVVGVAAGVRSQCRLGRRPRHLYFPTAPALVAPSRADEALAALAQALRVEGAAEVGVDSFDAQWQPEVTPCASIETRDRVEYLVPLDRSADDLVRGCSKHHRRHLQNGIRQDWTFQTLDGPEARAVITAVQHAAADRAAERGDPFHATLPAAAGAATDGAAPWGVTTFSVWANGAPLAAALVGWAKPRAYYLVGGSTPAGYTCHAAVWLHWRIMCHLVGAGFTTYNLGGTPATARLPDDPQHGLYRFKSGFGTEIVSRRSVRWTLRPVHVAMHRLVNWAADRLPS
jgi:Acetyltransferase (GNAT) domain